jgi:hypothetical protein
MLQVVATAVRTDDTIEVAIRGLLRSSGWGVQLSGIYPGDIFYDADPGRAEVHISEFQYPGARYSMPLPLPWKATVNIEDARHDDVAIYFNEKLFQRIVVIPTPRRFEVYTNQGSDHLGSVIVPVGHPMSKTFRRAFGPATHDACVHWINDHRLRFY